MHNGHGEDVDNHHEDVHDEDDHGHGEDVDNHCNDCVQRHAFCRLLKKDAKNVDGDVQIS